MFSLICAILMCLFCIAAFALYFVRGIATMIRYIYRFLKWLTGCILVGLAGKESRL